MPKLTGQQAMAQLYEADVPGFIRAIGTECKMLAESVLETKEGDVIVEGWFITEKLIEDRRMVVKTSAFQHADAFKRFNGRVLGFHNQFTGPVGKVTELTLVKNKGIKGKVLIYRENSPLFLRAVRDGVLSGFSIGFEVKEWSFDEEEEIVTITKAMLKELSIVNIGADENATFEVKNAHDGADVTRVTLADDNDNQATFNVTIEEKLAIMSGNNITLDKLQEEHGTLKQHVSELRNLFNAIKDTQAQFEANAITKGELAERLEKMSTAVEGIRVEVEQVKAERQAASERLAYTDFRSLIRDFVWLTDDDGNKLNPVAQRAYCLFQMPVDYDKMEAGTELKNLRDLHDAVLLADAMMRYKGRDRYSIQNLKLYKQLIKATEAFDKDVALAMAGGNTGYGAEWLPTELSAEFNEYLRVQPSLMNRFQLWNMPKGGSAKYPFQNGRAVVYKGSEAVVDNAEEARKTNVATGVKTFTPDLFIGALIASEEVTEDAVLDMVSFIRGELATALLEGMESAICNGDDSATHFDNSVVTKYQSYQVETAFKGIRKLAIADSKTRDIEVSSASTGVNALEIVNFTDCKQDMGVAGLRPEQCLFVTGIKGRTQIQQALFKEDALGVLAFMISGKLPTIDGSDIHISGQYLEELTSAGIYDSNTDTKHTSITCVHLPSFRAAQRRGVTLEYNKNIMTQQQQFVATARWDFGKISADNIYPVSSMINVQHTA